MEHGGEDKEEDLVKLICLECNQPKITATQSHYLKLKSFLESLRKPLTSAGIGSLAFSGILSHSYAVNASDGVTTHTWVIDSRATNHMAFSSTEFISYIHCPSNKKITIADSSITTEP